MAEPDPDPNKKRDRNDIPTAGGGDGAKLSKKAKLASPSASSGSNSKRNIEVSTSRQGESQDNSSSLSDSLEQASADLKSEKDKNEGLAKELAAANEALKKSKGALADSSGTLSFKTEELASTKAGWSETKDELADAKGVLSETTVKLEDAKIGWGETKGELAQRQDELEEAVVRIRSSDKTVGLLSDKLEQAREELKELKKTAKAKDSGSRNAAEMALQLRSSHKTVSLLSDSLEEAQTQLKALKQAQAVNDQAQVLKDERQSEKDRDQAQKDEERAAYDLGLNARSSARDDEVESMRYELASLKEERSSRERAQAEELAALRASNDAEMATLRSSNEAHVAELHAQLKEAKSHAATKTKGDQSKYADDIAQGRSRLLSVNRAARQLSDSLEGSETLLAEMKTSMGMSGNPLPGAFEKEYDGLRQNLAGARAETNMLKEKTADAESGPAEISFLKHGFLRTAVDEVETLLKATWTGLQKLSRLAEEANQSRLRSAAGAIIESLQRAGSDLTMLSELVLNIGLAQRDASSNDDQVSFLSGRLESANSRFQALESSAEAQLLSSSKTVSVLSESLGEARAELAILKGAAGDGQPDPNEHVVEKAVLSLEVAGRVIGKGGETIRDLQARSGAHMDVDQSVLPGKPRSITYQGPRAKVELAKQLVRLIAAGATEATLPLGEAKREAISIPATAVGRVIGRGGEIVRELQNRSRAKVDFDHDGSRATALGEKVVLVTGTPDAVVKAKEMVVFIAANPDLDAIKALNVLVDDKLRAGGQWGSGVYPNLPNQGVGMTKGMFDAPSFQGGMPLETNRPTAQPAPPVQQFQLGSGARTELVYCQKQFVGRIIGSKGSTIKDLQQRSGTTIRINQDVPFGADCEIKISGMNDGVLMAKQMINQIVVGDADHLFGLGKGSAGGPSHVGGSTIYQTNQARNSSGLYPKAPQHGQYQAQTGAESLPPQVHLSGNYQPMYPRREDSSERQTSPRLQPMAVDSGWRKMAQPDGRVYYWNEKSGATQWEKPPGML